MATDVVSTNRATENVRLKDRDRVGVEDLLPVRSRVGWGAVFAGAVVALAAYLVLTLLGAAAGLTISDDVNSGTMKTGAAIWAILTTVFALFLGGWVTTCCTVGETKAEAVIHGVIMWGAVLFMMLWLVGTGMRAGFNAMWGVASFTNVATQDATSDDWEAAARRNNVPQETIDEWKQSAKNAPEKIADAVRDPANQKAATEYATRATWYTLLGTLLSMAAAVGGALVGSGPSFKVIRVHRSPGL